MKTDRVPLVAAVIVVAMALIPAESRGQADPVWLEHWNKAQEDRPSTMTPVGRIAKQTEPGKLMLVFGQVLDPNGKSIQGVVVHAYHRDSDGFDFGPNDDSLPTWRLQGWVQTGTDGRFEFRSIRPAADHLGREGAHIHFTLESKDYGRQWAPTVYLADDPLVSADQRRRSSEAGEFGTVQDVETVNGIQQISVKIQLKKAADF